MGNSRNEDEVDRKKTGKYVVVKRCRVEKNRRKVKEIFRKPRKCETLRNRKKKRLSRKREQREVEGKYESLRNRRKEENRDREREVSRNAQKRKKNIKLPK